jgi:uncharacterized protein
MRKFNFTVLLSVMFLQYIFSGIAFGETHYSVTHTMVKMPDGISLSTDIYLPVTPPPYPAILIRSPYNKSNSKGEGDKFTKLGYAVVIQDTRGKFASEGIFYPFKNERKDGLATINWIQSQKWFNGKIAGWGGSYVGYTQWAIADQLDAFVPVVTSANMYDLVYPNGIFSLATAFNWGLAVDSKTVNSINPEKLIAAYSILPLSVADDSTFAQNDFVDDWLKHESEDDYWDTMNHRFIQPTPMYSIAGWWDIFLKPQIEDFVKQGNKRHPDSKLLIGPYAHGKIIMETDYGEHANLYRNEKHIQTFLANKLKNEHNNFGPNKPFSFFIIHKNVWVEAEKWPPQNTRKTDYYFSAEGQMSKSMSTENRVYEFTYDPINPFMSLGGTFLGIGVGPAVQNPNLGREDQVVFESQPLTGPLTLLGPINVTIYFSSDVKNTELFVSLQEVLPTGDIINIQEGGTKIVSQNESPQKLDLPVWPTGYQINAGNKMRVQITSSLFPRYNRTLNNGGPIFSAQTHTVAHHKIYVGDKYPSSISLPVFKE